MRGSLRRFDRKWRENSPTHRVAIERLRGNRLHHSMCKTVPVRRTKSSAPNRQSYEKKQGMRTRIFLIPKSRRIAQYLIVCVSRGTDLVIYSQIRCIPLRKHRRDFWVFLFRQSSQGGRDYANHNATRPLAIPTRRERESFKQNRSVKLKNFALLA